MKTSRLIAVATSVAVNLLIVASLVFWVKVAEAAPATPSAVEQVDQLVAPIALYPDPLVAQILAAATYPIQIVEADRWMQAHARLKGRALAAAVNAEPWDGSVKAMLEFPQVLSMMDKNLSWTSSLGEAYVHDSQSVMSAIQQMRLRAERAGNLESNPQENVTNQGQVIVIEPSDPEVVYVPDYDPWLVYGEPLVLYPDWTPVPGLFIGGPGIYFGIGIPVWGFGGFGWGWNHWGADWHGHGVFFHHHRYVSRGLAWNSRRRESFGHVGAGEFSHGVGFSGGALGGQFTRGAAPARFAVGRGAGFGGFHGARLGGFHGGGAGFRGMHGGGSHR
jgi:Protein of unknown function (DUF3300)